MKRNETKSVKVGNLILGGNDKVYIQSMTTTINIPNMYRLSEEERK